MSDWRREKKTVGKMEELNSLFRNNKSKGKSNCAKITVGKKFMAPQRLHLVLITTLK